MGRAGSHLREREDVHELSEQEVAVGVVGGHVPAQHGQVFLPGAPLLPLHPKVLQHLHVALDALVNDLQVRRLSRWEHRQGITNSQGIHTGALYKHSQPCRTRAPQQRLCHKGSAGILLPSELSRGRIQGMKLDKKLHQAELEGV